MVLDKTIVPPLVECVCFRARDGHMVTECGSLVVTTDIAASYKADSRLCSCSFLWLVVLNFCNALETVCKDMSTLEAADKLN